MLERVTYGLASGREGSRQGFGAVLTELLQSFPKQTPLGRVLAVVEEKMDPTGEKGDAEKQIYFGKIFAVACVMRSGRLATAEPAEREAVLGKCFAILVAMFEKRSYMKELVAHTLVELLGLLASERELRQIALPALQSLVAVAPDDCSPESLALLLALPSQPLGPEWQQGVPLLRQSEQIKPALLASSYAHPRVHFVWKMVLDGAQAAGAETVRSVWTLVDAALFGSHVDNRKYLAFSLLIDFLRRAQSTEDVLFFLGSPNTTRALVNNLAASHATKMSDVATRVLDEIKHKVTASPPLGLAMLQARFLGPVNLDLQLVPLLPAEFGLRYLDALLAGFGKEQGERLVSAVKRGWKKWAGEDKDKSSPAAAALAARATEMTRAFAKLAFLSEAEAERQWARMRLASVLTELEVTGHAHLLELCQWLLPQLGGRADAKTSKLLSKAFRLPAPSGRYELAFSKVLSLLALEMLEDGNEATEARAELWEDAVEASTKFAASVKQGDGKERNRAVLVLVSLMLELLTTPSALHRAVVVNAFRLIAPMVPEYGIRDIVAAIISTENEDAEEQGGGGGGGEKESGAEDDEDEEEGGNLGGDEEQHDNHRGEDADHDIFAGESLPDIMLEEADPEYLKRVEESLGNIFRAMKEKKANSGAKKASAALDFKLRVVDLLENFVHSLSRMASMEALPLTSRAEGDNRSVVFAVLPLLLGKLKKTQHSAALKQLNDKLQRVVLKEVCEMREWPSMAGHARVLFRALRNVAAFATRGNPTKDFAALIQGALVVLIKVLSHERLLPPGLVVAELLKVARFCCTRKNLRFLTMDKFFAPMWKRVPETAVQLLPALAEAAGDKEWTQHARGAAVAGIIDFLLRGGKSHLLQEPGQVVGCVQSLERAVLAWLRFESGKSKPQALAKTVGEVRTVYVELLGDPRLGALEKSQLYNALPLRGEVAEVLTALMAKYPQASKLKTQGDKLIKLFHLEQ